MKRQRKAAEPWEITIEKLVYGGSGFARHDGKVVFVPFSVPGDRLLVRAVEEKKNFVRAEIVRILEPGEGRKTPPCRYFTICGGCHWQQLEYAKQVEAKRQILEETFHHRFPDTSGIPITMRACTHPFSYRSRARMQVRGSGSSALVGFFRCGSHIIQDIEDCPLFREPLNEALSSLRQFKTKVDHCSELQEMDMACSAEEDTWATARTGTGEAEPGIIPLLGSPRKEEVLLKKIVGEFTYYVTASVFFQANDYMTSELVATVQEAANEAGNRYALDLFAGVGLFSLPLAGQFAEVVAVENSHKAMQLCARNARSAGLTNIRTACAEVLEWMETQAESKSFDLVLLDPPRVGAGPQIMNRIREWAPGTIIYVSCDPQTLVRDLAGIAPHSYRISMITGLDMFPQTFHFETVVLLQKL